MPASITPTGEYARFTDYDCKCCVRPMTAKLVRSEGSWWLEWEDGKHGNLHHSSALVGGFRKADMVKMLTRAT